MGAAFLVSCDNIDENERWSDWQKITPQRNVLVEDFTGQKCSNCPQAAQTVENLKQDLLKVYDSSHIISVAIHGGPMAMSESAYGPEIGLGNQLGDDYVSLFEVTTWPKAQIDRTGLLEASAWTDRIMSQMSKAATADLKVTPTYDATTREVKVTVEVSSTVNDNANVQVWLTESEIAAPQIGWGGSIYTHNHVLRATMNGLSGDENVTLPFTKTYSLILSEYWDANNMAVVAFAYNSSGVMQSVEEKIIK